MIKGHKLGFLKGIGVLAVLALAAAGCSSSDSGGGASLSTVNADINASGGNAVNAFASNGGTVNLDSNGAMTISQSGSVPAVAIPADAAAHAATPSTADDIVVSSDADLSTLVCFGGTDQGGGYHVGTSSSSAASPDLLTVDAGVKLTWDEIDYCADATIIAIPQIGAKTGQLNLLGDATINGTIKVTDTGSFGLMEINTTGGIFVNKTGLIDASGADGTSSIPGGGDGVAVDLYSQDNTTDVGIRVSGTVKSTGGNGFDQTAASYGGDGGNVELATGVASAKFVVDGTIKTDTGTSSDPNTQPAAGNISITPEGDVFISGSLSAKGADSGKDKSGNDFGAAGTGGTILVTSNLGNMDVTATASLITTGGNGLGINNNLSSGNITLTAINPGATLTMAGTLNAAGATKTGLTVNCNFSCSGDYLVNGGNISLTSDGAMTVGGKLNAQGGPTLGGDSGQGGTISLKSNNETLDLKGINQINVQGGSGTLKAGAGQAINIGFANTTTDITNDVPMVADGGITLETDEDSGGNGGRIQLRGSGSGVISNTGSLSARGGDVVGGAVEFTTGGRGGLIVLASGTDLTNTGAITVTGGRDTFGSDASGDGGDVDLLSGWYISSTTAFSYVNSGLVFVNGEASMGTSGGNIASGGAINADGASGGSASGKGGLVAIYSQQTAAQDSVVITAPISARAGGADAQAGAIGVYLPSTTLNAGELGLLSEQPEDVGLD